MTMYARRLNTNRLWLGLSMFAAGFGLLWLVLILGTLVWNGVAGLNFGVFTQMTPPPGGKGGLLNPIVGSFIMTVLAVLI
jgi:phosphate transport system permease protein